MLCFEGISLMLKIFLGKAKAPNYRTVPPPDGEVQVINVHQQVGDERSCTETDGNSVALDVEHTALCVGSSP